MWPQAMWPPTQARATKTFDTLDICPVLFQAYISGHPLLGEDSPAEEGPGFFTELAPRTIQSICCDVRAARRQRCRIILSLFVKVLLLPFREVKIIKYNMIPYIKVTKGMRYHI